MVALDLILSWQRQAYIEYTHSGRLVTPMLMVLISSSVTVSSMAIFSDIRLYISSDIQGVRTRTVVGVSAGAKMWRIQDVGKWYDGVPLSRRMYDASGETKRSDPLWILVDATFKGRRRTPYGRDESAFKSRELATSPPS